MAHGPKISASVCNNMFGNTRLGCNALRAPSVWVAGLVAVLVTALWVRDRDNNSRLRIWDRDWSQSRHSFWLESGCLVFWVRYSSGGTPPAGFGLHRVIRFADAIFDYHWGRYTNGKVLTTIEVAIPGWLFGGLVFGCVVVRRIRKGLRYEDTGAMHCMCCGYDLRGTVGNRCNECGTARSH